LTEFAYARHLGKPIGTATSAKSNTLAADYLFANQHAHHRDPWAIFAS
jgi:hypothetical protein